MSKIFTLPFRPLDYMADPQDFSGENNLGLYAVETTQRYVYGTRHISWDGRVFKYCNSVAICVSYHGACAAEDAALAYTAAPVAGSIGDKHITATLSSRAEDDLAGGYFILYHSTIDNTTQYGIVGNDATSGSTTRIYLDARLPYAGTTSFAHEVFENPYREISEVTNAQAAWIGVPMMTTAASQKGWSQTFGPCLITPTNGTFDDPAANERMAKWDANAGLSEMGTANINQIAGFILNQGSSNIAGPFIMLWCSI